MTFTPETKNNDLPKEANFSGSRKYWLVILVAIFVVAVGAWAFFVRPGEPTKNKQANSSPKVPVVAVEARKGDIFIYLSALGSVTPVSTITVRTRVDGELMEVLYREGQTVKSGDLLARIDPRPFEVQLTQAEGQMAHDLAQLKNAQLDLERYRVLWEQDSIPKQQLDTQEALVHQLQGQIKTDQGQIDSAKLQLTYCQITAPISGRVGLRLVDRGNIVHSSDTTGLVVITQLQPITVVFPISEDNLPQVLVKLKRGSDLTVEAYDREMKQRLAVGSLVTVDNQIDPTTGTVRLKAIFANEENDLFPNQFVNARLLVDVIRDATVVPTPAIQRGPQGTFVYVVKPDLTVTVRPVTVGETQEGETSIKTGLSPGERVVVEGADRLREGTRVEPKARSAATTQRGY